MANVNNNEIIKRKGSNQLEEVSEDLLTIQQTLDNLIQPVVDNVVNKSVGAKKCGKGCNSAKDRLRREKEKHILHLCSSVDESKKGYFRKCQDNFSQKRRIEIHEHYWGLSKELQNQWISHMVNTVTPAWPRKKILGRKERKVTRIFHLEKERREKVQVCEKTFLSTLGLTGGRVIRTVLSKTSTSRMTNISDKSGKHTPAIQKKEEIYQLVIDHIQKFHPCISRYRRASAPNRLYISPEFTITSMYQDFCTEHPDVTISYVSNYKKVKSFNISFVKLGEEECEKCDLHEKHLEDCHRLSTAEFCEISVDGWRHLMVVMTVLIL